MRELVFNITAEHDGKQAYHYLRYCEHFSYALIVKMRHTENSLLLDGIPIRTIDRIRAGSVLKAYIPEGEIVTEVENVSLRYAISLQFFFSCLCMLCS